ncbi:bis(5'-adenosyl)-triphosphatase ENPP4-like [Dendronephthya gigantea]|uniref:bis(5'-adenosyl)-triphosphatase ENPP4-like n=1 Tax=Dendronephthya gigantea TaxID=151771 RepID=UPI00106AAB02|nr:bis(5'-adenosyl)-triphosphatase ENPP4-like [Dendronephthya gigantea]
MNVALYFLRATLLLLLLFGHSTDAVTVKPSSGMKESKPNVLLFSIGGLREEYLLNNTNIAEMIQNATMAKYIQNSVNVIDIVDHYSMVTGLFPESHGIISHTMFDPILNRVFNSETREEPEWWSNVHPIWQEIENQGQGLGAVCRWPGVYGPMVPTLRCGQRKSLKSDIDQAAKWFKNGVKLVLLYSDDIKKAAVKWGPFSQQVINEVKNLDSLMKYLLEKTRDLNVNILFMSDSGVSELNSYIVNLDRCLNPTSYVLIRPQATLLIYPKRGYTVQEIYKNLTRCEHVKVYLKEDLPERFHFSNNPRIPPIVAFLPLGAVVRSSKRVHSVSAGEHKGATGYHPGFKVMRGVFIGYGPSFKRGLKFQAIRNVDIYGVLCHILGLTPRPNNGSYDVVKSMFNDMTSFAVDTTTSHVTTDDAHTTEISPKPITDEMEMSEDVRVLFWILVAITALLVLFCLVGCITTMVGNYKQGAASRTKVLEPDMKKMLADSSSEEE